MEPTLSIGKERTPTPVSQVSADDLDWYANKCRNQGQADIARAELARRGGGGGAPAPAPRPTALAVRPEDVALTTGSFRDPKSATEALQKALSFGHLVAPAPICGTLPEGCSLAIAAVQIDIQNETYNLAGKRGLSKAALDKIAGAAGVSWDPHLSRRLDNGSDPHYCHYKAVGRVRDFDGTVRFLQGEVEMDARDGSPQIEEIRTKAASASPKRDPSSQILELRKFLLRHAESKAKNRAIRSLGVRTSFAEAELAKPFIVAKIAFTGESQDPELRKMFAEKTADSFLSANAALYGGGPGPALLPAAAGDGTHSPPPVGAVPADDSAHETEGEEVPPSRPAAGATAPQPAPAPASAEGKY